MLETKPAHILLVLCILALSASVYVQYNSDEVSETKPSNFIFCYYTVEGGGSDGNSPNKKIIIQPVYSRNSPEIKFCNLQAAGQAHFDRYKDVLKHEEFKNGTIKDVISVNPQSDGKKPMPVPLGDEYRGILLTNMALSTDNEFKIRNEYFRQKIDEAYSEYHSRQIKSVSDGLIRGVFICLALGICKLIFDWVRRGNPTAKN